MEKNNAIKVIAFDADDTLWENETFFREAELQFVKMMKSYSSKENTLEVLYDIEMANMPIYGYGVKGFVLSLVETANILSNYQITGRQINAITEIGKEMLNKPVVLLDDVEAVLRALSGKYRLIVATKGDLLDQERKLKKSGLLSYFHHIEVMSDKTPEAYQALLKHLDIQPKELLMVGNSLKSDILPVLKIGGWGVHVPFHTTWQHEVVNEEVVSDKYFECVALEELLELQMLKVC